MSADLLESLFAEKGNPHHDALGRFTTATGAVSSSAASGPSKAEYQAQADAMLASTSRTAAGTIDTSASANKKDQIVEGAADKAKDLSTENFRNTINRLYDERNKKFESPEELDAYIDQIALDINQGILKPGKLLREEDSSKFPYTAVKDLAAAKKQFAAEFHARLDDPDAVGTAAWAIWRTNYTDHFYADGVGRTSNAVAAFVLMRHGEQLPKYRSRKELFSHVETRKQITPDAKGDNYRGPELTKWTDYYRSLIPTAGGKPVSDTAEKSLLDELFEKHNPYHDSLGRFTTGPGAGAAAGRRILNDSERADPTNFQKPSATAGRVLSDEERTNPGSYKPDKKPVSRNDDDRSVHPRQHIIDRPSSYYPPANPEAIDTQQRFVMAKDGKKNIYTKERQELHKAIVDDFMADAEKSPEPTIWMMGGGPAAGKSTLIKGGVVTPRKGTVNVDPDKVKTEYLPEFKEMTAAKNKLAAKYVHEESSDVGKMVSAAAIKHGADALVDGTGDSSIESLRNKINGYKSEGHKVKAHYVTCDTKLAVTRAQERAKHPPFRGVEDNVVREIHKGVSVVLPKAIAEGLYDEVTIWDTNQKTPRKVASAVGKDLTVHDRTLWMAFLAKANE